MLNSLDKVKGTKSRAKRSYVSFPDNKHSEIEYRLNFIFEEELQSEDSILISYKPEVITKLAKYLSGNITRC